MQSTIYVAVTLHPVFKYYKYTVLAKTAAFKLATNRKMESDGHYSNGTRYGADEIIAYAGGRHGSLGAAFLDSPIAQSLKSLVYGKTVLDIGCGVGDWCSLVAQCGAKLVHGFDIQEEMVELAKQATSHLDNVHIQVGDAAVMPYDDASFDVAISLFVTCNLSPEAFEKHFEELHRVLVPGGKAVLLIPTDWSHSRLYTKIEADATKVENNITQYLAKMPVNPTTAQVTEALKDDNDILITCFATDAKGDVFHVKDVNQLTHGQPIWRKTEVMVYPNFFYSDQSSIMQILTAGLHIDKVKNCCTEERRVAYNRKNPSIPLSKKYVQDPPALVYYVSKPVTN